MLFRSYIPGPPLSAFVEDFRLYRDYAGDHQRELILPSGTFELVFNLRADELRIYDPSRREPCRRFPGALISGPYAGPFMTDMAEEAAILQVHFRPGGAAPFLGLPAGDFADTHLDLRTLWGPGATVLHERLCALREPDRQFRLLEQALLARLSDRAAGHSAARMALDALIRTRGGAKVRDLAETAELSQRRLIAVFTAEVGLRPKLFGRIQRFQHAVALAQSEAATDWAQIAADCGYFDQSHLIREFAALAGVTPSPFRRRQHGLQRAGRHVKRHHLPLA